MPWLDYMIKIMLGSIPHKNIFFIIYLLEDEQELSLGMLMHLHRIYNFWLFHANIIQLSHIFGNFLYNLFTTKKIHFHDDTCLSQ